MRRVRLRTLTVALTGAQFFGLIVLTLHTAADPTPAQPTPTGTAASTWIRPEEVSARADTLLRRLDAARAAPAAEASLANIEKSFPEISTDLDASLLHTDEAVEKSAPPAQLEDARNELMRLAAPLADWKAELETEAKRVADVLDEIAWSQRLWSETRKRPETAAAGDVTVRRVDSVIAALNAAAGDLRAWRGRVLADSDRVIDRIAAIDAALEKLRRATARKRASLFIPDAKPLWSPGLLGEIRQELPRLSDEIAAYGRSTREYIEHDARPLVVQGLLAALLMFALGRFSSRMRAQLTEEQVSWRAARLLECPYAIGLLVALLASPVFHPLAPHRFLQLVATLVLFPVTRIVMHASERANVAVFVGLFLLLLFDRIGLASAGLPTIARVTYVLTLAIGLALAVWWSRRARLEVVAPWLRRAGTLATVGLACALVAETTGWTTLASLLGRGILAGGVSALYIYTAVIALDALLAYALASNTFRHSYLIGRNRATVQRRGERALRWLGAGLWAFFVLSALGLRGATTDAAAAMLDSGISVGALSLSLGGVLAFVLTLLAAFFLARIVTAVLEEDVYPRAHLPRGVPYALSTLVRYGVYSLGFLFALAAAGVQFGQVTIMLGGLGIGIGLGLQDVVKNFAAGLTLLLERRVNVGDTLELPSQKIFGRILTIGMRASVIRDWNGAEVVVPNGDLVANSVTNWTLSDRLCRIEVPVGVAYGSDPEHVLGLLIEAAKSVDQLLKEPAPRAWFRGFGDSSLDFVVFAWTDEGYDRMVPLRSALGLAVHRKLSDAQISIPYPQREVHLASVSATAQAALAGDDEEEDGE